ncbi:MAG TPA: site-specific integrase [Bryobacteraceae bacterium]|nr:site-specific integrase [Bryobacteraceae bacterium]
MAFLLDINELKPGLIIFRRKDVKHHNWYCRIKIADEDRYKTISLKTDDINKAKSKAFYHDADTLFRLEHKVPIFDKSFAEVAKEYSTIQKAAAEAGQITMGRWSIVDSYIRLHLIPYTGNHQITLLGEEKWRAYPHWRKNEGGNRPREKKRPKGAAAETTEVKLTPAKDGTIRHEMMVFRAIMNYAAGKQYIRESQVPRAKMPKDTGRREEFTPQEYKELHTYARKWIKESSHGYSEWHRTMAYNFMLVMTNTGMRTMEAQNLRWRDVDLRTDKHGRHFVCINVRGKGKFRELVAANNVATYLERIRELFIEAHQQRKPKAPRDELSPKPEDFVFTTNKGKQAMSLYNSLISDLLEKSKLLYGPNGSQRSSYCFRHTYATFRLKEGLDVYFLAKQMGTSVQMIEEYYGHITPAKNAERILQGIPGWEPIAEVSGEAPGSVNADGAGKPAGKPRAKKKSEGKDLPAAGKASGPTRRH